MSNIIRIEKLSKHYQDGEGNTLEILQEIDFEFSEGKTTSIVGKSGSGKSTLLHLLGGLDTPTSGNVLFRNDDIFGFSSTQLSNWRNRHVGFVFQAHHLLPDFTAIENIMLPIMVQGTSKLQAKEVAQRLLDQMELVKRADHKPGQLSGGERQRIAIARSLANAPDLILADEPTGNLDVPTGEKIADLLKNICQEQKKTLIMVTHNPQLAASMDYQLELSNHKLIPKSIA